MEKLEVMKLKAEIANLKRVAERLDDGSIKDSLFDRAKMLEQKLVQEGDENNVAKYQI